jgi:TonB family protein
MRRLFWPMILLSAASIAASARTTSAAAPASSAIDDRERHVALTLKRAAQYVDVPHISSRPACADVQPPEALTTPDPLLTSSASSGKIKVSFIIGTDGRVHSPLILESAGVAGDRRVLQTVRTWRYRPATCNGVPTETEGKIEFSNR